MKPSTRRLSSRLFLTLTVGSLLALAMSGTALATHARPKSASPSTIKLVPAYACVSPDTTHATPLAIGSCAETAASNQTSDFLTAIAPDRSAPYNGPVDLTGSVTEKVTCLTPGTTTETGQTPPCFGGPEEEDIRITVNMTGVRCFARPTVPTGCAASAGSLYSGQVLITRTFKMTDHSNNAGPPTGCSGTCTGTTASFPANWGVQCTSGTCNVVTSYDLLIPGWIQEGKRALIAEGQLQVEDAGSAGVLPGGAPPTVGPCPPACSPAPDGTLFLEEGLFAP